MVTRDYENALPGVLRLIRIAFNSTLAPLILLKAWHDPAIKDPRTLHHRGKGRFMVAGESIQLDSKMK